MSGLDSKKAKLQISTRLEAQRPRRIKAYRAKLQDLALWRLGGAPAKPARWRQAAVRDALSYHLCVARNPENSFKLEDVLFCYRPYPRT